jgi:hypothetical protein
MFTKLREDSGFSIGTVLAILVIISTFLLLYFGMLYHTRRILAKEIRYYNASQNALSGMNYAKKQKALTKMFDEFSISEQDLNVKIKRYLIGFSEHISSFGNYQGEKVVRHSVLLQHYSKYRDAALVTTGKSFFNPVYITGNTSITGNILTGRYGFSKQSMRDIYYKKKKLFDGKLINHTKSQMPETNLKQLKLILGQKEKNFKIDTLKKTLYLNFQTVRWETISDLEIDKILGPGTLKVKSLPKKVQSFKNINFISENELYLTQANQFLQSMIYSKKKVQVDTELKENQFISEEMIELGNVAQLTGKNLVMVLGKNRHIKARKPRIIFAKSSQYEGDICYTKLKMYDYRHDFISISIPKNIRLKGIIYSPFGLSPELTVSGVLMFNYTSTKYRGTTYQNYLKDLKVKASENMLGYSFLDEKGIRFERSSQEVYR